MTNTLMKVGGVGCIIWLVASLLAAIGAFVLLGGLGMLGTAALLTIIATFLFVPAGILLGLGGFGMWKNYQHILPLIGGILVLVFGIMALIAGILLFVATGAAFWVSIIAGIIGGVGLLLLGISIILLRAKTGLGGLALGTAIMFIIAGGLNSSVVGGFVAVLSGIWNIIAMVAMIMGMIFFFKAQ